MSALSRKARGDLRLHPGKNLLIVITLGLAIGSFAIVAVPDLLNTTMQKEVAQARLYDVAVATRNLDLSPQQLDALSHLPNVAAFDPAVEYSTVASAAGGLRENAVVWGLDLQHQPVDAVQVTGGRTPSGGEVMADEGNASATGFAVPVGGHVTFRTTTGAVASLPVSGAGRGLATSPSANGSDSAVFYGTVPTVRALAGVSGFNYLAFRLDDNSAAARRDALPAREVRRAGGGGDRARARVAGGGHLDRRGGAPLPHLGDGSVPLPRPAGHAGLRFVAGAIELQPAHRPLPGRHPDGRAVRPLPPRQHHEHDGRRAGK